MTDSLLSSIVTVTLAIIAVAFIAVLVSKNANTANVISAGSQGLSSGLMSALSPVTGAGVGQFSLGFSGGAL